MKRIILLGLAAILFSCETETEIRLKPTPSRLVVNASVTSNEDVTAHISRSWSQADKHASPELSEATVEVYVNDEFRGIMVASDNPADTVRAKGLYSLPGTKLNVGDKLSLRVESEGYEPVSGDAIVPPPPHIESVDTISLSGNHGYGALQLYVQINDPVAERNYYRLVVEKVTDFQKGNETITTRTVASNNRDADSRYYVDRYVFRSNTNWENVFIDYEDPIFRPSEGNPLPEEFESYSSYGTFSDDLIREGTYTLRSVVRSGDLPSYSFRGDSVVSTVYYNIHLLSISESYYRFMRAAWHFTLYSWNLDGLREPIPTFTNVENGYGLISAYQMATYRMTMPFGDIAPRYTPFDRKYK